MFVTEPGLELGVGGRMGEGVGERVEERFADVRWKL